MSVKLELFRVFKAVCEKNSISDAADELFISQSAVSQSIKQLEQGLNTILFTRSKKGVRLTAEGTLLYEYVSSAIDLIKAGETKLELMKQLEFGELKIAASDTISNYLLLPKLEQFSHLHPKIKLRIINRTTDESISLVKSAAVDLAFINMPVNDNEVDITHFMDINDIFVAAKHSALIGQTLTLEQLANEPLILLEKKSVSRRYVEQWFESHNVKISPEIELGSHDLLLEFARINLGISCVIKEFSQNHLKKGELVSLSLTETPRPRSIGIATLKGVTQTPSALAFMELLAQSEK